MIIFIIQLFLWLSIIITIISHILFQCVPSCKKFLENKTEINIKKTGNLFGAHNKKVAKEITAVRPATCVSMQPEIIQPAECIRTLKEEEIAKGNVFTKKDNHPTFEDIKDDWEPSIEELGTTTAGGGKNNVRDQKRLFKPPKPENSYTKKPITTESIDVVKKKINDEILSTKSILDSSNKEKSNKEKSKKENKTVSKRPRPSKIARTLREEEIATGKRKKFSLKEEPTLEEILDDWG